MIVKGHLESSHSKDFSLWLLFLFVFLVETEKRCKQAGDDVKCSVQHRLEIFLSVSSRLCHMVAFAKCHQLHRNRKKICRVLPEA